MTPTEKTNAMNRENFDPVWVIGRLERAQLSVDDMARLLNEACYVISGADHASDLQQFIDALQASLQRRYDSCQDFAATPSSILEAVLLAVREAKEKVLSQGVGEDG